MRGQMSIALFRRSPMELKVSRFIDLNVLTSAAIYQHRSSGPYNPTDIHGQSLRHTLSARTFTSMGAVQS